MNSRHEVTSHLFRIHMRIERELEWVIGGIIALCHVEKKKDKKILKVKGFRISQGNWSSELVKWTSQMALIMSMGPLYTNCEWIVE